jgi:hypothetical protein
MISSEFRTQELKACKVTSVRVFSSSQPGTKGQIYEKIPAEHSAVYSR